VHYLSANPKLVQFLLLCCSSSLSAAVVVLLPFLFSQVDLKKVTLKPRMRLHCISNQNYALSLLAAAVPTIHLANLSGEDLVDGKSLCLPSPSLSFLAHLLLIFFSEKHIIALFWQLYKKNKGH
jgi:hypothetical protein